MVKYASWYALLKICSKHSSHSAVFIENGCITVIEMQCEHIMVKLELNYGYLTLFYKNGRVIGQFAADF